jgi:ribose transport system ATP-binding protein
VTVPADSALHRARTAFFFGADRSSLVLVAAIVVTAVAFSMARPGFLSAGNLVTIVDQTAAISLVAFGMTVVIITRNIDLSVGSSLALSAVVGGEVMVRTAGNAAATILAVLVTAVAVAAVNGFLVAFLRVNAFMATLGMYALARGAATSISGGASTPVTNDAILAIGRDRVLGVPLSVVATLVVLVLLAVLLRRTVPGRWFYAVGGNQSAAVASGIPTRWVQMNAYLLLGLMVGIASLATIGRVSSTQPLAGQGLEFSAITAAVIGGTSLAGGRGNVVATFLGSIFVGLVSSGLSFLGVDQAMTYVCTGALIVVAVLVSQREVLQALRTRMVAARSSLTNRISGARRRGSHREETGEGDHVLAVDRLCKTFAGVTALDAVTFDVRSGEVIALMGENGAGKSTLVKILAGDHRATSGTVSIDGVPVDFAGPDDARRAGIAVIHQHFTLVPDLTVAENLYLGHELRWWPGGPLRPRKMQAQVQELLRELEVPVRADAPVGQLSVGHRQMIEIVRAVRERAWLVIMDEPTSALSSRERDHLYTFIERLRQRNTAVLYISHKMDEIYHLCERAVVLRDGSVVGRPSLADVGPADLVAMMVGRSIENVFPYVAGVAGDECLVVDGVSDAAKLRDVSFTVRRGEIVGLAGLMGSGRTEVIRAVMGLSRITSGHIEILGRPVTKSSVHRLAERGVAYVPEDRHGEGIFAELSVGENISILWARRHSRAGVLPRQRLRARIVEMIERLAVRPPDPARQIRYLSGGNQQKVVLGKWLALEPTLILLDDPTRGVDVGAKAEIHGLICQLKQQGAAVVVTSSEVPEVLGVADRVVVLRDGAVVAELPRGATEEEVMQLSFGDVGEQEDPGRHAARHPRRAHHGRAVSGGAP